MKKTDTNASAVKPAPGANPAEPLIRTVAAAQTELERVAAFLRSIDAKLEAALINVGLIRFLHERKLTELEHARQDAIANRLFGADPAKVVAIDRQIEELSKSKELADASDEHAGLVRLQAETRKQIEEATAAEQRARHELLRHLELEEAAEMEAAAAILLQRTARVEMLAQLRGTHGVNGLNETTYVRLPIPVITNTPPRLLSSFREEQELQLDEFVESLRKSAVKVTTKEVAALGHGSEKPYTVRKPIKHDGVNYSPNGRIDLTADQAQPLLASGAIVHGYREAETA